MKKTMKKLLPLLLAVVMCLAFAGAALAEVGANTIKVDGLSAGDTVKYVQVIKWDQEKGWVRATGFEDLSDDVFNAVVGSTTNPGAINDSSAAAIAKLAASMADGGSVATGTTSWSKNNLDPGLYMVQPVATTADVIYNPLFLAVQADGTGSELNLPLSYDNNGTAKKSDVTVDKKTKSQGDTDWADATTEDVGDIIDYQVTTTVPAYLDSWTKPVFTVSDTLTDGLTFKVGDNDAYTSITVEAEDTTLAEGTDYKVTKTDAQEWAIEFQESYLKGRNSATTVTITYQAKITADAKNVNPETNTVTIDYSRNPNDASDHGTKEDKTTHYTFDIDAGLQGDEEYITSEIIKVGVDSEGNPIPEEKTYSNKTKHHPLAGAEFKIYKDAACTQAYTNNTITENTVFTTTDMGLVNIKGLDEGTYFLKETKAAPGYMLLTDKLKFTITATYKDVAATETCNAYKELDTYTVVVSKISADDIETPGGTSTYTLDNGTIKKTDEVAGDVSTEVVNTKGQSLPSTGGIGTTIFYIAGSALVLVAGAALFARRVARKQS